MHLRPIAGDFSVCAEPWEFFILILTLYINIGLHNGFDTKLNELRYNRTQQIVAAQ